MFDQHKTIEEEPMTYDTINFLKLGDLRDRVEKIETFNDQHTIYVSLHLVDQKPACPLCNGKDSYRHGHIKKRLTHSIITHSPCIILYHAKRYKCKICGKTYLEDNPLSNRFDSISTYTKMEILNALRNINHTFTQIAETYRVSIQKVVDLFDRHVDCKRLNLPEILCIDEIYTAKISAYKYACVLLNFKNNAIVDIIPTRHKNYLSYYFRTLQRHHIDHVKYVIIDMYEPYKDIVSSIMPKAKICIDSFHVIRQLNEAIKRIRIDIMNQFKDNKSFDHTNNWYYMLKKFHYFFVKDFDRIYGGLIRIAKFNSKWNKYEIREYLLSIDKDLRDAYYLKEAYRAFNHTRSIQSDEDRIDVEREMLELIYAFKNSPFESFRAFGSMLDTWKPYIINSMIVVGNRRLSNGPIEGMNSKIRTLIKVSNGMRNFKRFRNRCMYALNKKSPIR
jgi:transposase